ncbi:unnamed protein product [Oikopleura dioica]|uniref:WH2 domain-containing protein n=1 Tax=Oikopleura dioica TaxID=34765 RepID=E4YBP4_OIKDI|nr:unnamed protein product [Oikopleura dioica]
MSNYREMLEDYRDLDIDELMKGMSEAELLALDEELERDVIQPNPSYSLRAPTPPPTISDDDSSDEEIGPDPPKQQMVGIPAPLYRKLIEEGKGEWIEHPAFGRVFQPDLSCVPAELLRPAPVDQVKRIEKDVKQDPDWMAKQLRSVQIDTQVGDPEDMNQQRLQDQIGRLNSIPKRKEEYSRQFTNKTDRQLNQVKSALQQVDQDEIQRFKEEYDEEDVSDEELVNPNSPEEILSRCWENENDLTVINLNNILNIPHELLEELMEALEAGLKIQNVYVRELSLVNTGIPDKVAHALAKMLKRNRTLEKVSVESNFITGDGAAKIVKALQKNTVLSELRIDNQRHIFGQNVEQEFVKYLRHNETLCRFGYQFGNAGHRMTCNNYLTRNTDKKRRERLALKKALGGSCREPRKQIKVVSTAKKRRSSIREMQQAPAGQIPLPRRVTERENDLGDSDITTMLEKLDPAEMARLEEYFKAKGGVGGPSTSAPGPPPPPAPAPSSMRPPSASAHSKSARKNLLNELSAEKSLKKVVAPQQRLILPEAIGSEEGSKYSVNPSSE